MSQETFLHNLLLTDRQVASLRKAFANNPRSIKVSKTQLYKITQSCGLLGRLFGPVLEASLPLMKNVITLLAKSVLVLLGLTAATSAVDLGIHQNILGSGTTLIMSNEEMIDILVCYEVH